MKNKALCFHCTRRVSFLLLFCIFLSFGQQTMAQKKIGDSTAHSIGASDCKCTDIDNTGTYIQHSGTNFALDAPNVGGGRVWFGIHCGFIGYENSGDKAVQQFLKIDNAPGPAYPWDQWSLWVAKGIVAKNYAITDPVSWADFVFEDNYKLRSLKEVEEYIKLNKHLPDIPSEEKLKKEGYTLLDMNAKFMQKIEELTLYAISQDKQLMLQQEQIDAMREELKKTQQLIAELQAKRP
jgi:hypothetical protein